MARMVATKAALSIRVDALTDTDGKSEPSAPSIGIENRAKLESRLRALEHAADVGLLRTPAKGQQKFAMASGSRVYNHAADAVDLLPTERDPNDVAMNAVLEVKQEKKHRRENGVKADDGKSSDAPRQKYVFFLISLEYTSEAIAQWS